MELRHWKKGADRYSEASEHYDEAYFLDQSRHGAIRAQINSEKFVNYCVDREKILDFGCGDGALLSELGGSYGVEISSHAIDFARKKGHIVENNLNAFEDDFFDLIISNHCIEHVENPLGEIRKMRQKIKSDGLLVIVVPCHAASLKFRKNDRDFHLFSWSAANLGNMVSLAGFDVVDAHELVHRWPPKWKQIRKYFGRRVFDISCRIWGRIDRSSSQVICIARPETSTE
ncbi:MAG: hypothetical protein COB78_01505 [Hyphomicrobiales bacterium]|nr:MAG: hypothetical protein COB78_01505 [Hyphomicrobiales bacterium]